jgi:predicted nuclease with TOPRIM domain
MGMSEAEVQVEAIKEQLRARVEQKIMEEHPDLLLGEEDLADWEELKSSLESLQEEINNVDDEDDELITQELEQQAFAENSSEDLEDVAPGIDQVEATAMAEAAAAGNEGPLQEFAEKNEADVSMVLYIPEDVEG